MTHSLRDATWRKSSYSNPDGGDCIEVTTDFPGIVPVRDSKDTSRAPIVASEGAWKAFVAHVTR